MQTILDQRKQPATCRYTYYLDPVPRYAVRRFDLSFAPDTLLSRSNFRGFPAGARPPALATPGALKLKCTRSLICPAR